MTEIIVENVAFSYPSGVQALRGVSLTVESGEAVAILGENGAGKSTLAKHLNGLLKPGGGRVLVGEWDTREHTAAQMAGRAGYVFQNPDEQLFERVVRKEVAFGPHNLGYSEVEVDRFVMDALMTVGLEAQADAHPYDLPLSQRKLLALATVLAMQPPVIILDEPTTGQDANSVALIGRIVEDLKEKGRTVLTISHDVDFCAEHFPRMVLMARGQITSDGPTQSVLSQIDLLLEAAVEPSQMIRLAAALQLEARPLTVGGFVACLAAEKEGAKARAS